MKRITPFLLAFFLFGVLRAQRISHIYNNVSLSDALRELSEQQTDYTLYFLYDELEDFRITTTVRNKPLPDAIQQMVGFYPIRVSLDTQDPAEKKIFVECTHKARHHLTGRIVGEHDEPVAYANIALLSPQDSTLLGGGVSNEGGYFVVPHDSATVLARISFVGYKTVYRLCGGDDLGTIQMQPEIIMLGSVQIRGERIFSSTKNGCLVYDMPTLLQVYPANDAYEALTRISGVTETGSGLMFAGRPVTLIINGKPTTLSAEQVAERLKNMPAAMLARAEVMPSAPLKYHVRGMAINVVTKDFAGTNQLSGQLQGTWRQHKYGTGRIGGSFIYNHDKFGLDVSYTFIDGVGYGQVEHEANHLLADGRRIPYSDVTRQKSCGINHEYRVGVDYAFSDDHRLNAAYTGNWVSAKPVNTTTGTTMSVQRSSEHDYLHNIDLSYTAPFGLQLGASYTNYQNPRTQHLDGKMYDRSRNLFVDSRQRVGKWLFTADQTHALRGGWELMYGAKAQFTGNNSYQTTLDEHRREVANATSRVDYNERILNVYAGASKQIGEGLNVEASVSAEQYHATKWNEWRIYPVFNAMWTISPKHVLNLSFSSESVYPSYWSTMSSIFYSSAYSEIWGNPDLKPASSYGLNLMWQWNRRYTFTAFAQFQPNYSVQLAYQPLDRMAVIMKETNFDFSNYCGLQASVQFRVGSWLHGNVTATGVFRHDKSSSFFDLPFNRTQISAILSGTAVARLSARHNIQFVLNPRFQSKAIQGVYDIAPVFRLNASLRWTSPRGQWSLTASGNNVQNGHFCTRSALLAQDFTMRVWMDYVNASFTIIHRIGNFKEKKKKEVDTSRMGY
ncbi:MAG: TonB-dependent receptor family protein [Bacteroidaceae bacterium]|nr:TonB-dependent receptor family protein [Bacteroidaceae bacterium]